MHLALPSLRYAFALRHIPASIGAVLNSTAPMFGALLAALFLGERFTGRKAAGCCAGIAGVVLVVQPGALRRHRRRMGTLLEIGCGTKYGPPEPSEMRCDRLKLRVRRMIILFSEKIHSLIT